jgi:hypothetical protein
MYFLSGRYRTADIPPPPDAPDVAGMWTFAKNADFKIRKQGEDERRDSLAGAREWGRAPRIRPSPTRPMCSERRSRSCGQRCSRSAHDAAAATASRVSRRRRSPCSSDCSRARASGDAPPPPPVHLLLIIVVANSRLERRRDAPGGQRNIADGGKKSTGESSATEEA